MAEIIQRVRPDILLLQEFDFDAAGAALRAFQANYLARSQNGAGAASSSRIHFFTESNTGSPVRIRSRQRRAGRRRRRCAGLRRVSGPVRHGAAVALSDRCERARAPSANSCGATCRARCCPTIRHARRRRLVFAARTRGAAAVVEEPLGCAGAHRQAHAAPARSHPTPPAFDGPEDRNGRRNHDEIRFWSDYLTTGERLHPRRPRQTRRLHGQGLPDHGRSEFRSRRRRQPQRCDRRAARASARRLRSSCRRAPAPPRPARRRAARMPRSAAIRATTPRTSTIASAGNLRVDYLLPSKGTARSAAAACSGRRRPTRPPRWCGATAAAELGSPARVAGLHCRRSSMPTGQ